MLNRRSLRIKAMQNLYAFDRCKQSNFNIAMDQIKEAFAPDLNSMEKQDVQELNYKKNLALKLFQENCNNAVINDKERASEDVRKAISDGIDFYHRQNKKDFEFFKKNMVAEVEKIEDRYLLMLVLLIDLADYERFEYVEKKKLSENKEKVFQSDLNFYNNKIIDAFRKHQEFQQKIIRKNIGWNNHKDIVKHLYKETMQQDAEFAEYKKLPKPSLEDDSQIVSHLVKNIFFKNEVLNTFMEENDINWEENKSVVRSMVVRTLKTAQEEQTADWPLAEYSVNWEDDKLFFMNLFSFTVQNETDYENLVAKKSRNWDFERIAEIDKTILKIAISEMINFPSIPVKVSINEYIDISKVYSTPKSRQFINGLLDVIADELVEKGQIKKSGRGLIDNK